MKTHNSAYEKVPTSEIETVNPRVCSHHKSLRMTKKGRELVCDVLSFILFVILFINFVFALAACLAMLDDYKLAQKSCNHKVDAIVIDQTYSAFYDKCDIKLEWKAQNETKYTTIKGYDCHSNARLNTIFPKDTCYKEGESELRVFPIGDADIYSATDIEYYKKMCIKLFCMWLISAVPMSGFIMSFLLNILFENCRASFEYK